MNPHSLPLAGSPPDARPLPAASTAPVVAQAAPCAGVLAGRNIGLLCEDPGRPDALVAFRAAIELGAHVSLVRPRLEDVDAGTATGTARMLGRLYDAVACVALAPAHVRQLRDSAGVPVLDDASVRAARAGDDAKDAKDAWQAALVASLR